MKKTRTTDQLLPTPTGAWTFDGHLGERIKTILEARITSDVARDQIVPELVTTFQARVDDVIRPGSGMWQGEFWGKWLLSAVEAARYLNDDDVKDLIWTSVNEVLATQDADGYLGTYRNPDFLVPLGEKAMNWNIWGRKYTLWGLLAAWDLLGEDTILAAAEASADHLMTQVGPGKVDIIRTGTLFGLPSTSILTPIVMLYEVTSEARYLGFAEYIVDQWARHPAGPPDILHKGLSQSPVHTWFPEPYRWAKSYEFISCVEGLLHLYRITGRGIYFDAVRNIYEQLRIWERSLVGSISFNDKFVGSNRLINTVGEICDAVYWNRLSFELLSLTGDPLYADEFERSLYNALLTGMNPQGTWGLRRLRLAHEHVPAHRHCDLAHQQCCVANSPRGLLQAAGLAWMRREQGIACVLYNAGEGTVRLPSGRDAVVRIEGTYPKEGTARIHLAPEQPEIFTLSLRIPAWSAITSVAVNSEAQTGVRSGDWFEIKRSWKAGDIVELTFDMSTRVARFDVSELPADDPLVDWSTQEWGELQNLEPGAPASPVTVEDALPHQPAVAFVRGPIVLAQDQRLGELYKKLPTGISPAAPPNLEPIDPPKGIWMAFAATDAPTLRLCDFASAGNTWDAESAFDTWMLIPDDEQR